MDGRDTLLMVALGWVTLVAFAWLVVVPFLRRAPGGDAISGLLWRAVRVYCRVWHRARYLNRGMLPSSDGAHDGLIVVSNHTGAVDPLLIQASCPFLIRWMMAADMMGDGLDWLWRHMDAIPVDRHAGDAAALRTAIRHVRGGGAVGVFPEGRITTPPREVRPFLPGVGLLVKTRAPVLLAWVSGTPDTNRLGEALATRSESRVVFIERHTFEEKARPAEITSYLRERIAEVSGWPLNDEMLPVGGRRAEPDAGEHLMA